MTDAPHELGAPEEPGQAPERTRREGVSGRRGGGGGPIQFLRECRTELEHVQWPDRDTLVQATGVVIFVCLIVGVFLYGADEVLRRAAHWLVDQQAG
jgi:preprotein translocase SecE subunit